MKRSPKLRRWPAVLLAALIAVGMHQSAFAQVLCIGEDGHVEVELASDDCCRTTEPASNAHDAVCVSDQDGCVEHCGDGACIDVPLGANGRVGSHGVNVDRSPVDVDAETVMRFVNADARDEIIRAVRHAARASAPPANVSVPLIR